MVKCSRCGVDVPDSFDLCPNCGNDLNAKSEPQVITDDNMRKCKECGSDLPENIKFCPSCGSAVEVQQQNKSQFCSNCGTEIDVGGEFCPECGSNIKAGKSVNADNNTNLPVTNPTFTDKINLNIIAKPTIYATITSLVLSSIGLLIGFSWLSYDIAIMVSCIVFAALIDNEANSIVFGAIVGFILGLLENPLVDFWYGSFVAGFYEGFFGGQILLLIILGIIFAYISNVYLKDSIRPLLGGIK